jgi:uridine phosphorylase
VGVEYRPAGAWPVRRLALSETVAALMILSRRETAEEIAKYRAEAILTVEMEASCLFTVAKATGTAAAAAFVVSDVLHGEQWEPHFGSADVLQALWILFEAAETCLSQ